MGKIMEDKTVEKVIKQLQERSEVGIKKYGTTLDRNNLSLRGWLEHQKQELLDGALYCQRAIDELDKQNTIDHLL